MSSKVYSALLGFILCFGNAIQSMEGPGKPFGKRKREDGASSKEEVKKQRKTDFFNAVKEGNIDMVRTFIERDGTLINATNSAGCQPIHCAAEGGHIAMVEYLLSQGADINASNRYGRQLIHYAAEGGHIAILEYLLSQGADINAINSTEEQPIHYAARYGQREVLEYLLERGADLNATNNAGEQPIHYAAWGGHREVVEYLLGRGADLNATDNAGVQPIHYAVMEGHLEVLEYLLERGADLNATDNAGDPPIQYAAWGGHREVVRFLIRVGAVLGVELDWGELLSALSTRAELDSLPVMQLYGLDVEVNVPQLFMMAAGQNQLATVQAILDDHRDKLNADDLIQAVVGAATAGHTRIVDLIYTYMNRDDNLRQRIPQALSTALARAAAQGQLNVIYTIMRRDGIIRHSEDSPDLPTDFSLLSRAETLLRQLLEPYSALAIATNERLSNYNRILQTFENRRMWRRRFTLVPEEPATYFNLLPGEVLENILHMLTYNYLHGLVLSVSMHDLC